MTRAYPFSINFPASKGLLGIQVANRRFALQDSLFIDFDRSSIEPGLASVTNGTLAALDTEWTFNITAAVSVNVAIDARQCSLLRSKIANSTPKIQLLTSHNTGPPSITATFAIPVSQPGNMSPRIDHSASLELHSIGSIGPFTLYSAVNNFTLSFNHLIGSSVDIPHVEGSSASTLFFSLFNLLR